MTASATGALLRLLPPALPSSSYSPRPASRRCVSCQVAVTTAGEAVDVAELKVGKKIRVKAPVKIYHVAKAPELDLEGMEGVVKQYVGVWKGIPISPNMPFKAEFVLAVEGQQRPVKFSAHLREEEFEFL